MTSKSVIRFSSFSPFTLPKIFLFLNRIYASVVLRPILLAAEGLDVPALRYVIFATPEQNETTVIQAAGRVGRKADGKEFGTVIDFVDDFGLYRSWYVKRLRYYQKIDAQILP